MAGSPFYARIKADVLIIVASIPKGRVCTFSSIGEHLDVVPRHVAYILSTLEPLEKVQYPWHRVVGNEGNLGKSKTSETGESQSSLLAADGILVAENSVAGYFSKCFIECGNLKSGVKKQTRPVHAAAAKQKKVKAGSK
jgi:methylated-DNA-protein-cysteine methyltransferase related protein